MPAKTETGPKIPDPFARVPKSILKDKRLDWAAKGVMAYLVGQPEGWIVRVTDLCKQSNCTPYAIRQILKAIREAGYATLETTRDDTGRVTGTTWKIHSIPVTEETSTNGHKHRDDEIRNLGGTPVNGSSHRDDEIPKLGNTETRFFDTFSKNDSCTKKDLVNKNDGFWANGRTGTPTPTMLRLNKIFRRRETTRWSSAEIKTLRQLEPIPEDEIGAIETYYGASIPEEKNIRRRDLATLLNNWNGEVDRARNYRPRVEYNL